MRIRLKHGQQKNFLEQVKEKSGLGWDALGATANVNGRTVRDWRREAYHADFEVLSRWAKTYDVTLPTGEQLERWWYTKVGGRKGALARMRLYGDLGTPDGRKKGGVVSQRVRKENPEKYRALGCNVAKGFACPAFSNEVAELAGILLGDGNVSKYQIKVWLDRKADREYVPYVVRLIAKVFGEVPSVHDRPLESCSVVELSGVGVVRVCEELGLFRGNKVKRQVGIPAWITENQEYSRWCVRGLVDTDGSIYYHRKAKATYAGWNFCSRSRPLLDGVRDTLLQNGIRVKQGHHHGIFVYNGGDVARYFSLIGTSNPKHQQRYDAYVRYVTAGRKGFLEGCTEW